MDLKLSRNMSLVLLILLASTTSGQSMSGNEGSNTSTSPVTVSRNETTITPSAVVTPGTPHSTTTMKNTTTATSPMPSSSTFSPSPTGTTKMRTRTTRILPLTTPRNPALNPRMCFCNGNGGLYFCEEFKPLCKNLPNYSDHKCSCKVRCRRIGYVDTQRANCVEPAYMFGTLIG